MTDKNDRISVDDEFSEDSIDNLLDSRMIDDKDADEYDSGIVTIKSTSNQKDDRRDDHKESENFAKTINVLDKDKTNLLEQNATLKGEIIDLKIKFDEMQDGYDKLLEGNTILQNKLKDEAYQKDYQIEQQKKEYEANVNELKKQHEEEIGGIYLEYKGKEKEELLDQEELFKSKIKGLSQAKESLSQKIISMEEEIIDLKKENEGKINQYKQILADIDILIKRTPAKEPK